MHNGLKLFICIAHTPFYMTWSGLWKSLHLILHCAPLIGGLSYLSFSVVEKNALLEWNGKPEWISKFCLKILFQNARLEWVSFLIRVEGLFCRLLTATQLQCWENIAFSAHPINHKSWMYHQFLMLNLKTVLVKYSPQLQPRRNNLPSGTKRFPHNWVLHLPWGATRWLFMMLRDNLHVSV